MKKIAILSAIALSGLFITTANAQVRVHVGLNLGPVRVVYTQRPVVVEESVYQEPAPAPVYDDNDDDYYYLPDVDAYYDVTAGCYYYNNGYDWISAAYLPGAYRNYDWRSARRFEVREHRPFMRADVYRTRYNGRIVNEWRNGSYNRGNDNPYGNRGGNNWGDRRNDNRNWNRDNHSGFGQPSNRDRNWGNHNGYGQPNHNNGGHDRGQGGFGQSNQSNGGHDSGQSGFGQPSQNNGRDQERGGNQHFAGNRPATMSMSHRVGRF